MSSDILHAPTEAAQADQSGGYPALWDWRRQVASLYAAIRATPDPAAAWTFWRGERDRLFREHPQSPIAAADRDAFGGLPFFPYDPALRFCVGITPVDEPEMGFEAGHDGPLVMRPFGRTAGLAERLGKELTLYWLKAYGGGVFLPFADPTGGTETYGAGRYLLDTIKSADLGSDPAGRLILDFNFAYNPSCSYSPLYVCPLAPAANRLSVPVRAGEMSLG